MTNNIEQLAGFGTKYTFFGIRDSASPNYVAGTSGTLAAGEDSGMGRLLNMSDITATTPEAPQITSTGDNGPANTFKSNPTDSPSGSMAFATFDLVFDTKAIGQVIYAEGPHDIALSSTRCYDFKPVVIVVNSPAKSNASATYGEQGYQVEEYWQVETQPMSVASKATGAAHSYTHSLSFDEVARTPYGELAVTNYLVNTAWKTMPYWSKYPVVYHTYVGDGQSAQTFTLDYLPYAEDGTALQIWINGTKQTYTTNYTVDNETGVVTFVSTVPASGAFAVCKVMFVPTC